MNLDHGSSLVDFGIGLIKKQCDLKTSYVRALKT